MGGTSVPRYRQKANRNAYLVKGEPYKWFNDEVRSIEGWAHPIDEEIDDWEAARDVVEQKNKKREFLISKKEGRTQEGFDWIEIEILHMDMRGFFYKYSANKKTTEETSLYKAFWPVVCKLIAHCFSPRIVGRPT